MQLKIIQMMEIQFGDLPTSVQPPRRLTGFRLARAPMAAQGVKKANALAALLFAQKTLVCIVS